MTYTTFERAFDRMRYPAGERHLRARDLGSLRAVETIEARARNFGPAPAGMQRFLSMVDGSYVLVESGAEEWWPEGLRRIEERLAQYDAP